MMRALLFSAIALFALRSIAQVWCPPGADWHWSIFNLGADGYAHRWYAGDTLVYGKNAQAIRETGIIINYWSGDTNTFDDTRFTAIENEDVLLWTQLDGTWLWDTLYRFGGVPGTIWRPASGFFGQGDCLVQVSDTSTTTIYGPPLKQLTLTFLAADSMPASWTTTLTERIGAKDGSWLLTYQCYLDAQFEILRCYSDDSLSYVAPNWHWGCDSFVGTSEIGPFHDDPLFPNPGTDHFTIQLPANMRESRITLFDAQGRIALHHDLSQGATSINCRDLTPGLFTYRIEDDRGSTIAAGRWVKE